MIINEGDNVVFLGCSPEQVKWGNNDDPNEILEIGSTYKVVSVDIHSQHTKISLDGFLGKFNSVCFSKEYASQEI